MASPAERHEPWGQAVANGSAANAARAWPRPALVVTRTSPPLAPQQVAACLHPPRLAGPAGCPGRGPGTHDGLWSPSAHAPPRSRGPFPIPGYHRPDRALHLSRGPCARSQRARPASACEHLRRRREPPNGPATPERVGWPRWNDRSLLPWDAGNAEDSRGRPNQAAPAPYRGQSQGISAIRRHF